MRLNRPLDHINFWVILLAVLMIWQQSGAQNGCEPYGIRLIGSAIEDERGYSLAADPDEQHIYVGGIKNDSAVILKITIDGQLVWTRTFDLVAGRADHIHKLLVDSEGMLVVAGTSGTQTSGGDVFAFRYDHVQDKIVWAKQYKSTSTNYCLGIVEMAPGGNFLMSNNPTSPNSAELIELDRGNGNVVPTFSRHYELGSSESFYDMFFYQGDMYTSGRFSDGGSTSEMRNTLIRMNAATGSIVWSKLGHRPSSVSARLYGFDLVAWNDFIYSVYSGDDQGASIDDTHIFLQKTTLDGDQLWVKQYDFAGANDWVDEIIISDQGLVMLARNRVAPSNMILYKVDGNGVLIWSNQFDLSPNDNATPIGSIQGQLIETANRLFFTAYAQGTGNADLILVETDLQGQLNDTCMQSTPIQINVTDVVNPVFYSFNPDVFNFIPQVINLPAAKANSSSISWRTFCNSASVTSTNFHEMICEGNQWEGYEVSGTYIDTFASVNGCDSVRTLVLDVGDVVTQQVAKVICAGESFEGYSVPGTYTDTLQTQFGCDSIRTLQLSVSDLTTLAIDASVCDPSSGTHLSPGTYIDTVETTTGCKQVQVLTLHGLSRYIPNVFSPNGDQVNDNFELITFPDDGLPLQYFAIFDRQGNMAFEKKEWPIRWDGKDKNKKPYNPGVFAYVVRYTCKEKTIIETGNITIVK